MNTSLERVPLLAVTVVACFLTCTSASSDEPGQVASPRGEVTTNFIGMKFVRLPAGAFEMGAVDSDELADKNERSRHRVELTRPLEVASRTDWVIEGTLSSLPYMPASIPTLTDINIHDSLDERSAQPYDLLEPPSARAERKQLWQSVSTSRRPSSAT